MKNYYLLKTGETILWKRNHHGFVLVSAGLDEYDREVFEIRKPTPKQRNLMIYHHLRDNPDTPIKIHWLAEKLGVSDRTIQSAIRIMEESGTLESKPCYGKDGRQTGNSYKVLKEPGTIHRVTIDKLHDPTNPLGIRTWSWEEFRMPKSMSLAAMACQVDELSELRDMQEEQEEADVAKEAKAWDFVPVVFDKNGKVIAIKGGKQKR